MIFEQKMKLAGTGALATIAAGVFGLGTWKAIEGSALYMTAAEGRTEVEGLMYAAMIAGTAILASNAAVFMPRKLARVGFSSLAISLAALTIYTTHAGKAHDSDFQIDMTRQPEQQRLINEANEYQNNIQQLSESLAKNTATGASNINLPEVQTCTKGSKNFTRCNTQRTKQMEANTKLLNAAGTGTQAVREALEAAKRDKADAEGRLAMFDAETKRQKQEKRHDSLLTNIISSVLPELSSLLGSFFLGFFLKAMYMILREKQSAQLAVQFGTVGGTVRDSDLYQAETDMTRTETAQWSVISTMSQVQQTANTPQGAEAEFCEAIGKKSAPLSLRPAQKAYPLITRRRFGEIFEEKFSEQILNCRIDAKGNRNYEYPAEGEEGGHTFYTETAKARLSSPPQRGIYVATRNGRAIA